MKFSDLGVTTLFVVGKGIEMDELFGQHILIEKNNYQNRQIFRGKNSQAVLRIQIQSMFPNLVCRTGLGKRRRRKSRKGKETILFYRIRRSNWCYTGSRTTYSNHQQRS